MQDQELDQDEAVLTTEQLTGFFLELADLCKRRDWTFDQAMLHLCHEHLESALARIKELEEIAHLNEQARIQLRAKVDELERQARK